MEFSNKILYTIQNGDDLHYIANQYNTTIEDILANNSYINPYNLTRGTQIVLCSNSRNMKDNICISPQGLNLIEEMNTLWEQHVFWTRLLLISIAENLNDLEATKKRLLRNPMDIANIYKKYYGDKIAKKIEDLLTEHLAIGGNLIAALKNENNAVAETLTKKWYQNADDIAEAFSSINPYYDRNEVKNMLYRHLQLTTQEVEARLKRDYIAEIIAFDKVEKEALKMAKYFSAGIMMQFKELFK